MGVSRRPVCRRTGRELKIAPSEPHVAAVPKPQAATRGNRLTASPFFGQRVSDKEQLPGGGGAEEPCHDDVGIHDKFLSDTLR